MKKFFKIILWTVITAIFIGTFVYLYFNSKTPETVYATGSPFKTTIEKTTVLTGKIEPRDEIDIKPQISGIISEINVEAGDYVRVGDVIAHIQVIPDASSLSSAQSRLSNATIEMNDMRTRYMRDSVLFDRKVISREEYETSLKNLEKSAVELAAARDALDIVRKGVSRYNASESNTLVRSTIDGLVLDVPVKVGSSVIQSNTFNDGTTIATVADMNKLIFKGKVDETEVGMLTVGMPMEITIGAKPDINPTAVIEYISPKGNDTSGANTFEIKAALNVDNSDGLRSGYSANAKVILARAADVLAVSESLVVFEGDSTFVYVLTDSAGSSYDRRSFTGGISDGINMEIKEGLDSTMVLRGAKMN